MSLPIDGRWTRRELLRTGAVALPLVGAGPGRRSVDVLGIPG